MKTIQIFKHGSAEELKQVETPIPSIIEGEVLIKVEAISLNHFDILSRKGIYPNMKLPRILGMDCSGKIVESKAKNKKLKVGESVLILGETLGLGGPGAYSEYVNVPEDEVFLIPENTSFEEAASIGISYLTAYYAIKDKLGDISNQTVFIPGASGGVASALIQTAKYFGAKVIAGSRSEAHCITAKKIGADESVNLSSENPLKKIKELTLDKGVDIVINSVGGETIPFSMSCLKKKGGRMVIIGSAAGREVNIDIFQLLIREMKLIGCNFGSLTPEERGKIYEEFRVILANKKIKIQIDKTFKLKNTKEAHEYMESGNHFGKVILVPE